MKRALKIIGVIFVILLIIVCVILIYGNSVTGKAIKAQLDKTPLQVETVSVNLLTQNISLSHVEINQPFVDTLTGDTNYISLKIKEIEAGQLWFSRKEKKVSIGEIAVRDANADINLNNNHLTLEELDLKVFDISYVLPDSIKSFDINNLHYNDSVYSINLNNFHCNLKEAAYQLSVAQLKTENAGPINITGISGNCTINKHQYADFKGKVPATWSEFNLERVKTSPINIIRTALNKAVEIDTIYINGNRAHIFRDVHYKPKEPCPMPHEALLNIPIPLKINSIQASLKQLLIELTLNGKAEGQLNINNIQAKVNSVSNTANNTMFATAKAKVEKNATVNAKFTLTLNKQNNFTFNVEAKNAQGSDFYNFLFPLFGAQLTTNISEINMSYKADKNIAKGNFLMVYDGFKVHLDKDNIPIEKLSRYTGIINTIAPAILLDKNPRVRNKEPQGYEVAWKRDPMQNFGVFMMGPLIDGIMQTLVSQNIYKTINKAIEKKRQERASGVKTVGRREQNAQKNKKDK